MGGGVSLIENVEELMTTTMLIGRAISAMSFPGMYRIYDFHSKKAPKLRNARQFTFLAPDSDDEEGKAESEPDPAQYEHFFKVTVNGDDVYLENPMEANEAGWTPLHSCCMSMATVSAGLAIIDEIIRLGGDFETKTIYGPGTFNKGWTPLQMACGYGIDALVERLVAAGANVNAVNGFGYSCLHEACHRGFSDVVKHLLDSGKVDLQYIPPDELAAGSPFASAPCQAPLAEAARCGFYKIVQQLIDAGAPKNLTNHLGWTALHEACFYHRLETVKTLLLAGADPSIRTVRGALPYHLAGLPEIKQMLQTMGGDSALPSNDEDVIDMIQILTDLTLATEMGASHASSSSSIGREAKVSSTSNKNKHRLDSDDNEEEEEDEDEEDDRPTMILAGSHAMPVFVIAGKHHNQQPNRHAHSQHHHPSFASASSPTHQQVGLRTPTSAASGQVFFPEAKPSSSSSSSGSKDVDSTDISQSSSKNKSSMLGDLPSLTSPSSSSPTRLANGRSNAPLDGTADPKDARHTQRSVMVAGPHPDSETVSPDMPKHFLCQLTQKPMSEPVKTIYGNIYDKTAIMSWFGQQGRICPLTGLPLAEIDLTPMVDLGNDIRAWILKRSLAANAAGVTVSNPATAVSNSSGSNSNNGGSNSSSNNNGLLAPKSPEAFLGKDAKAAVSHSSGKSKVGGTVDGNNDDLYDF